jgi:hypothetical protein
MAVNITAALSLNSYPFLVSDYASETSTNGKIHILFVRSLTSIPYSRAVGTR